MPAPDGTAARANGPTDRGSQLHGTPGSLPEIPGMPENRKSDGSACTAPLTAGALPGRRLVGLRQGDAEQGADLAHVLGDVVARRVADQPARQMLRLDEAGLLHRVGPV